MASAIWQFSTTDRQTWNQGNDGNTYTLTGSALPSNAIVSEVKCSITLHASYYSGSKDWRIYYINVSNGTIYGSTDGSVALSESMSGIDKTFTDLTMSGSNYSAFYSSNINVSARANNNRDDSKTWILGITVTVTYTTPSMTGSSVSLNKSTVQLGESITANITRSSSSNYHTVVWTIGSTVLRTATNVGTSDSYTVATSLLPNSTSGVLVCTITTYNSAGTDIGSDTSQATIVVPTNYVPSVSITSITYSGQKIISGSARNLTGYTSPIVTVSISAGTGASLSDCVISCTGLGSRSRTSSGSVSFSTFNTSGVNTISAIVTDSRGRTSSTSTTVNVYNYNKPSMSYSSFRCNSDGSANPSGTYANISVSSIAGSLTGSGLSTISVPISSITIKSKASSASSYGNPSGTLSGSSIVLGTYSINTTYNIQITITDAIGTVIGVDNLYSHSNKVIDLYHSSSKDIVGFGMEVQDNQANYGSGIVVGNDWNIYNNNGLIVGVGTTNSYMIIYNSSQPTGKAAGQLWIKPVD